MGPAGSPPAGWPRPLHSAPMAVRHAFPRVTASGIISVDVLLRLAIEFDRIELGATYPAETFARWLRGEADYARHDRPSEAERLERRRAYDRRWKAARRRQESPEGQRA